MAVNKEVSLMISVLVVDVAIKLSLVARHLLATVTAELV